MKELSVEKLEEIHGGKITWSWKARLTMGDVACVAGLLGSVMIGGITFGIGAAIGGTLVLGACEYLVHNN